MEIKPFFRAVAGYPIVPVAFAAACGSGGAPVAGEVGTYEADGGLVFESGDASEPAALDAHIEENHVSVTFVTVGCSGSCADVVAVPTGGHAPYTFQWEDGSTSASRRVCPTSNTHYGVKVTDAGRTGELASAPQSVQVPLDANVIACPDAGITDVVSLQAGQEYELVQNAMGAVLPGGSDTVWTFYAASADCNSPPSGQILGSLAFDPTVPRTAICFRANADYDHLNGFTTNAASAAGLVSGSWQLCRGCSKDASP